VTTAGIARIRLQIDLVEEVGAEQVVRRPAVAILEFPAVFQHQRIDDRQRDQVFEPFQLAEDQRAMRPGAGERDIEMIAPGLGLEAAFARRAGRAFGGHPVAELRLGAFEMAGGGFRVIPDVVPDAVNEHAHRRSPVRC